MNKIKVLVVDDSFFMRKTISKILTTDEIEVIDTATNGKEGVEKALRLNPDVITMDIEMPEMNGLDAVKAIMEKKQVPILMLSSLTCEGADATIEALSRGAVDFITKKSAFTEMNNLADEIISKIKSIARSNFFKNKISDSSGFIRRNDTAGTYYSNETFLEIENKKTNYQNKIRTKKPNSFDIHIIGIGISTGGPAALQVFIPKLPAEFPVPILIAQHMPPYFTKSLSVRLDSLSKISVKEAENGEKARAGCAYLAPGGRQMRINKRGIIEINDEPLNELYKPSVDILINSIVDSYRHFALGIIMTGMGHDGSTALKRLNDVGGYVISQDIDSCVVGGMPKSVIDLNIASEIHPLGEIANAVASLFNLKSN
jgi:two-component system chemotaxis response regulator CheB